MIELPAHEAADVVSISARRVRRIRRALEKPNPKGTLEMSNALLIHDLADAIMRERLQRAAQQALLFQLQAAERLSLLDHLRAHPSVGCRRAS
jgi:hypothetical protein